MAEARVREFMNPRLVYLREGGRPDIALQPILDFGITAVPVLDDEERPVGVVSVRDLIDARRDRRMTTPVTTISADAPISLAAREIAESAVHHLVVVDAEGRAVGMISAIDVLRALIGLEPKHPLSIDSFECPPLTR